MRRWGFVGSFLSLLLVVPAFAGCGDDGGGNPPGDGGLADAANDGGGPVDVCNDPFDFPLGDADGSADPLGEVGAGQARAGRLDAAHLPPDPRGQGLVQAGDFVLANDRVAVVIEDVGTSDLYDSWGGKPVGMGRVEGGQIVDPVDFYEMLLSIGQYTLKTESVTVLNDGSDGGPAVVRAVGSLAIIGSLGQLIDLAVLFSNTAFDGMKAALDYELAPGSNHVDVTYRIVNAEDTDFPTTSLHLFFQESRMPMYAPGYGFDVPGGSKMPFMAYVTEGGTSYAWEVPEDKLPAGVTNGQFTFFLRQSGATVFQFPKFTMPACRVAAQTIGRLVVGTSPGLDGVLQDVAEGDGDTLRAITGTVRDSNGDPAEGVHVHATYDDGGETKYITRATTAADGTYTLHVPSDQTVELSTWRQGDEPAGPTTATPSDSTVDFDLAPTGTIHVTVQDGVGTPLPARVQVIPTGTVDYAEAPAMYGEEKLFGGRLHIAFPIDGDVTFRAPPGTYDVEVSHGYEYDDDFTPQTVTADNVTEVMSTLDHVVDTTGYMCADFHIHTAFSPDAGDAKSFKIATAIGDGLEIPVLSDHSWVGDFEDTIAQMDPSVADWAYGVSSIELTTFNWGHMGVFPLAPEPGQRNNGAVQWVDEANGGARAAPDVFDDYRAKDSGYAGVQPTIIINHGRDFGGAPFGEYFSAVGYHPNTGAIDDMSLWDQTFKLVEVFNNKSFDEMIDSGTGMPNKTLEDYFSFLNFFPSREFFAVGSSDSHFVLDHNSPVGYPRTCLNLGMDSPATLRAGQGAEAVHDVALSGDMSVYGGIFITASASGGTVPMGGTVSGAAANEMVHVTVQAPCWVDVDRLEMWVNGQLPDSMTQVFDLSSTNGGSCTGPVRFDQDVMVPVPDTGRNWVVFQAAGDQTMEPAFVGRLPFGMTNPIFFVVP